MATFDESRSKIISFSSASAFATEEEPLIVLEFELEPVLPLEGGMELLTMVHKVASCSQIATGPNLCRFSFF